MKMKKAIPALPVQDIKVAIEFYSTKLGFSVLHAGEGFALVERDEVIIHLWASNDQGWKTKGAALVEKPVCSGAESFLAGTASCRIQVQQVDELFEEYRNQGVLHYTVKGVVKQDWGSQGVSRS